MSYKITTLQRTKLKAGKEDFVISQTGSRAAGVIFSHAGFQIRYLPILEVEAASWLAGAAAENP